MTTQRTRTGTTCGRAMGALFLLAALAACGSELPTAQEIRDVDVATAESAVRGVTGAENIVYTVDGVPTTRVHARSLQPSEIAEVVVSRGETDSRIEIVTTHGAAQGLRAEARPSAPTGAPGGNGEVLVLIDGARASTGALKALSPERIASVAVLKDSASTAPYGPDATNGVMLITTRGAGAPPQPRKPGIVRGADGRILSVSLPQPVRAPTPPPSFYLIDGVRADESAFRAIPQQRIESIRVVKGSEARAAYGAEGTNGVVVVTQRSSSELDVPFTNEGVADSRRSDPMLAQQQQSCSAMLQKAWTDRAAAERAVRESNADPAAPGPITIIDGAFATPEEVRELRSGGPAAFDQKAERVMILRREAAEHAVGAKLPANVVCIVRKS